MKQNKKILIRIGLGLFIVLFFIIGLFVIPYFANVIMPWNKASAIETTLKWGGLAKLSENATKTKVDTEGSMFTREFIVEFKSKEKEVGEWILKSNGLKDFTPQDNKNGTIIYRVSGYEGSIGGTVVIDKNNWKVTIKMSWS